MIEQSPALLAFSRFLNEESSLLVEELWDAPKAALLALLAKSRNTQIVVITSERKESKLLDDLSFFHSQEALSLPSWEVLPEEQIAPSPDIVGKRLETLYQLLASTSPQILFCPLQSALQKVPLPKTIRSLCRHWKKGTELCFDTLPELLLSLGYQKSATTSDKGEFSVRGGIIDLFPVSSKEPFRIDFFADTIDQIRTFDPISQKSTGKVDSLFLSPASESHLLQTEKQKATLFDFLSERCLVVFDDLLSLEDHYVACKNSRDLLSIEELFSRTAALPKLYWSAQKAEELSEVHFDKRQGRAFYTGKAPLQSLTFSVFNQEIKTKRWHHPFVDIPSFFSPYENRAAAHKEEILQAIDNLSQSPLRLDLLSSSESEERTLKENLQALSIRLPKATRFVRGYLSAGFVLTDCSAALLPTTEFTKRYKTRRTQWRTGYHSTPASEFHELTPGDIVVHFHNGIGKFLGIEKQTNHLGQQTEFMVIEYAQESKLFVPVSQSYLVSRYIGAKEETPALHPLGTTKWLRTKEKAEKAIVGYAQELLRFSAEREFFGGFCYPSDSEVFAQFEEDFPFEESPDQLLAINTIKEQMSSPKAMDHLLCGDVGYGKTEVAMRAACKAVLDGKKQVAVLVPTTVLALQHYETFSQRMANYPVRIAQLSRFRTAAQNRKTAEDLLLGKIDIVIGTHRLLSQDISFHDLGLLIIDEEQRFGVRAKEKLKKIKAGVDCLTLSATPIPRTLYLSLIGIRAISTINTPPSDRLPVKTILAERESKVIQTALLRELSRDGQAFFIHNRIESIYLVAEELQKLLPEAKILVGHGQMSSDELDAIFHSFKSGEADILLSTTIVENGVDIPNANTIFVDRSDQFGLADLYQLRGRVGRWNRPAYAYFLVPPNKEQPELVKKRLHALVEASGFGGGIKIAMRDLELRGAGDILGTQQSGQVSNVGFHLYCKLLKRTVEALKNKAAPSFIEAKLEFSYDARLPEEYINASSLRMEIYHRLGEALTYEEVDQLLAEIQDRFGPPPPPVIWLYHMTRLRLAASAAKLTLLKIEKYSFTYERFKEKKSAPMIRTENPKAIEEYLLSQLQPLLSSTPLK